ncbi:MAG: signal peptidase II [bacterium]
MTLKHKLLIVGIAGVGVLLLDQSTKIWARATLLTVEQRYETRVDPTRGKRKIKPAKLDGRQTHIQAVGDRPGTRMWFILSFNKGSAFGLFNETSGARVFLSIIGLAALGLIFYLLRRPESDSKLFVWALAMVAGGAVGNLIDRIAFGQVTDFIWVWLTPQWRTVWPWPAFNIADIALVVGVGLMVPAMLFAKEPEAAAGEDDAKDKAGGVETGDSRRGPAKKTAGRSSKKRKRK